MQSNYMELDAAHELRSVAAREAKRRQFDMIEPEHPDGDEEGCIIITNETTFSDGEIVTHNGKRFRVTITEVPIYEELPTETVSDNSRPVI